MTDPVELISNISARRVSSILVLAILAAGSLRAFQKTPFSVTHGSELRTTAKPGERVSIAFVVRNTGSTPLDLAPQPSLPPLWRLVLLPRRFTIGPGEILTKILSFSVPQTARSGPYRITYRLTAEDNPSEWDEDSVTVAVEEVRAVSLALLESPAYVPAGSDIVSRFRVTNKGNTTGLLLFKTVTNMGLAALSDSADVRLASGESAEVDVRLPTRKSDRVQPQHLLQLETRFADQPHIESRASTLVEVIPVPLDGIVRYHEYPVRVSGIVAGEGDRTGGQMEVAGYGKVFDGKDDVLDLLLRGPDNQRISTLGKRDEYRITFDSPANGYRLLLGDQTYRLTPLTEFGRYSFGAGFEGSHGPLSGTVFAHETRLTTPRERQLAMGALYNVLPWAGVGAHYLRKSGIGPSDMLGLRAVLRPVAGHTLDVEVAQSNSGGAIDPGFGARAYGRWPWLVYDIQYIRAEPQFTGYYSDMQFFSAGATVMPLRDLRFEANVRMDDRNLERNPSLPYAPAEQFYLAGIGYGSFATLYFRSLSQWDRLSGRAYDRREDIGQLRLSWMMPRISLVSVLEYGQKADRVIQRSAPYGKVALYSSYSPVLQLLLGAWIEYTSERNLQADVVIDRFSGGASVAHSPWLSTRALLTLYASRTVSTFRATNMFVEGLVIQDLPWGHQVQARARYSYFDPAVTHYVFSFALEYGIPLAVPLGRRRDIGRMSGRLTDYETGKGVAGALLRTDGTAALTDDAGAFMFPGLAPGVYPVEIDRASIGLEWRPFAALPVVMTVEGGETSALDLSIVRSGLVAGRVVAYGYRADVQTSDTLLSEEGGLSEVVVELEGRGDLQRRLTNNRGEFRFPDLVPGEFIVRIRPESVSPSYRMSPDSMTVVVPPGGERFALFSAIERKRVVRVIQQGEIRVQAAAGVALAIESGQNQGECLLVPTPGVSGYSVQVSSWQTQSKAEAVALWASSVSGYTSSVEPVTIPGGSTRFAVRLGKVSDQEEGQMLCALLSELDRNRPSPLLESPVSVQKAQGDTTATKSSTRILSPEKVKELLQKSGQKKK